jgi:hypothetical protein
VVLQSRANEEVGVISRAKYAIQAGIYMDSVRKGRV